MFLICGSLVMSDRRYSQETRGWLSDCWMLWKKEGIAWLASGLLVFTFIFAIFGLNCLLFMSVRISFFCRIWVLTHFNFLNSEYWILKNTSVKYVLNTRDNYLYIISLYSFLIALYIKDVKPISSVQPFLVWETYHLVCPKEKCPFEGGFEESLKKLFKLNEND